MLLHHITPHARPTMHCIPLVYIYMKIPPLNSLVWGSLRLAPTILVGFFVSNMASEAISECLILKIFLGEHAPRPPYSLFTLTRTQWPYQSKIVGAGPAVRAKAFAKTSRPSTQQVDEAVCGAIAQVINYL